MFEIAPKQTEINANWDDANLYCMFLEIDGKKGWRLPTIEELHEIYQSKNDFTNAYYWSSTESNGEDSGDLAWFMDMSNGYAYSGFKGNHGYVRAVRDV